MSEAALIGGLACLILYSLGPLVFGVAIGFILVACFLALVLYITGQFFVLIGFLVRSFHP